MVGCRLVQESVYCCHIPFIALFSALISLLSEITFLLITLPASLGTIFTVSFW